MLNWDIIKNPLNWVIVLLMILIAGFVVDIACKGFFGGRGSTSSNSQ